MQFRIEEVEAANQKLSKEVNIAAATVNLIGAGAIMKAELQGAKAEMMGGSRDINPTRGSMNCANCTYALDLSAKGMPATATNIIQNPVKGVSFPVFFDA